VTIAQSGYVTFGHTYSSKSLSHEFMAQEDNIQGMLQPKQKSVISSVNTRCLPPDLILYRLTSSPPAITAYILISPSSVFHKGHSPYLKALKAVTFIPINETLTIESCLVSFFSSPSFGPQVESLFGTLNNWVPTGRDRKTTEEDFEHRQGSTDAHTHACTSEHTHIHTRKHAHTQKYAHSTHRDRKER